MRRASRGSGQALEVERLRARRHRVVVVPFWSDPFGTGSTAPSLNGNALIHRTGTVWSSSRSGSGRKKCHKAKISPEFGWSCLHTIPLCRPRREVAQLGIFRSARFDQLGGDGFQDPTLDV
jgi:hypothetical protein